MVVWHLPSEADRADEAANALRLLRLEILTAIHHPSPAILEGSRALIILIAAEIERLTRVRDQAPLPGSPVSGGFVEDS